MDTLLHLTLYCGCDNFNNMVFKHIAVDLLLDYVLFTSVVDWTIGMYLQTNLPHQTAISFKLDSIVLFKKQFILIYQYNVLL